MAQVMEYARTKRKGLPKHKAGSEAAKRIASAKHSRRTGAPAHARHVAAVRSGLSVKR